MTNVIVPKWNKKIVKWPFSGISVFSYQQLKTINIAISALIKHSFVITKNENYSIAYFVKFEQLHVASRKTRHYNG